MRRTYISPEFINSKVYGTFNMVEESNFFSSKMLEIEDFIDISNQDIIYYQKVNKEQLDITVESSLNSSILYSAAVNKRDNHVLELDKSQPVYQLNKNTRWILEIDLEKIFSDFIFSSLKKYRTFEGLKNNMTLEKNVDIAIRNYIDKNIKNRYKLTNIDFLIKYKDLRNQDILKWKNTWNPQLTVDDKFNKIQTETESDDSKIKVIFEQDKPSDTYNYDYYFNIFYEKL
jgi:hypothetical protein